MDETRQEDFCALAELGVGGAVVMHVPCKVYLPERILEKPLIAFQPDADQASRIRSFEASFRAAVQHLDGSQGALLEAPTVYIRDQRSALWGPGLVVATFNGEPQDFRVTRYYQGAGRPSGESHVVWWISPNKMLSPPLETHRSFRGDYRVRRFYRHRFRLTPGFSIAFDKHFRSRTDGDQLVQWSFLVGESRVPVCAEEGHTLANSLLPLVDDLLLVSSLATRSATACVGWQASDEACSTSFYRGKYAFPTGYTLSNLWEGLVHSGDFRRFVRKGYSRLRKYSDPDVLRFVIHALVPRESTTLERSFMSLFAALEMMILEFRKRRSLEFTLGEKDWQSLRDGLKVAIGTLTKGRLAPTRRSWLYSKLAELNRVPLRAAFDRFCEVQHVKLDDLWPVFGSKATGFGLSDIRNVLVHGGEFPRWDIDVLGTACDHLRWSVERILLSVLGWAVDEADVSPSTLKALPNIREELDAARTRLRNWSPTHLPEGLVAPDTRDEA
jgi:hypothetical protein